MKAPVLVSGIVLLAIVGAGGGYLAGPLLDHEASASGLAAPLPAGTTGSPTPSPTPSIPLIRKTPEPNPITPLLLGDPQFKTRNFTITGQVAGEVKMSIRPPTGWRYTVTKDKLDEVRFVDPTGERVVRVQSGLTPRGVGGAATAGAGVGSPVEPAVREQRPDPVPGREPRQG